MGWRQSKVEIFSENREEFRRIFIEICINLLWVRSSKSPRLLWWLPLVRAWFICLKQGTEGAGIFENIWEYFKGPKVLLGGGGDYEEVQAKLFWCNISKDRSIRDVYFKQSLSISDGSYQDCRDNLAAICDPYESIFERMSLRPAEFDSHIGWSLWLNGRIEQGESDISWIYFKNVVCVSDIQPITAVT